MFSNTTGTSQVKTSIVHDLKAQVGLVPNMAGNYRCMVVWDEKTNKDVGWVMVRKTSATEGLPPETLLTSLSKCQWRNWNTTSNFNAVDASTSAIAATEIEHFSKIDRCVQVGRSSTTTVHTDPVGVDFGEKIKGRASGLKGEVRIKEKDNDKRIMNVDLKATRKSKRMLNNKANCDQDMEKVDKLSNRSNDVQQCQECGIMVKSKTMMNHLVSVHNMKNMTQCTICRLIIEEYNLLGHRKIEHPEKFKEDLIVCSFCKAKVKAPEFENHPCIHDYSSAESDHYDDTRLDGKKQHSALNCDLGRQCDEIGGVTETLEDIADNVTVLEITKPASKVNDNIEYAVDILGVITCGSCSLVFMAGEYKYHDCVTKTVVNLNRLRIVKKKKESHSNDLVLKLDVDDKLPQHAVNAVSLGSIMSEDEKSRARSRNISIPSVVEETQPRRDFLNFLKLRDLKTSNKNEMSKLNMNKLSETSDVVKILENRSNLTVTKLATHDKDDPVVPNQTVEKKSALETNECKLIKRYHRTPDSGDKYPQEQVHPKRTMLEIENMGSNKAPKLIRPISQEKTVPRIILLSALVTEEPSIEIRSGEVLKFTVELFDQNFHPLVVQSSSKTACSDTSVLQFRLELLQLDGTVTLQSLLLSMQSTAQPAVMLHCFQPDLTRCRKLNRGSLQFLVPLYNPGEGKVKVVIATQQSLLCMTREVVLRN